MSGTEAHEAFAAGNAALADDDFENAIEVGLANANVSR